MNLGTRNSRSPACRAREVLDLATASKDPDRFAESVCTLAGLESIVRLQNIEALLADSPIEAQELQDELNALDRMAATSGRLSTRPQPLWPLLFRPR